MAHGIQYVQATQFFELPSSSARGVPELRNKKCLNPNLTCGTRIWGRSGASKGFLTTTSDFAPKIINDPLIIPFIPQRLELINGKKLMIRLQELANKERIK